MIPSKVVESETKAGQYYLINLLREQSDESLQHLTWYLTCFDLVARCLGIDSIIPDDARGDKENGQMGLTFTILALIFMQNNKVLASYFCLCKKCSVFMEYLDFR